jgi:hypothetical protein
MVCTGRRLYRARYPSGTDWRPYRALGGLVLQVSFMLQSDSMAFYDALTTTSGMNSWISSARDAGADDPYCMPSDNENIVVAESSLTPALQVPSQRASPVREQRFMCIAPESGWYQHGADQTTILPSLCCAAGN